MRSRSNLMVFQGAKRNKVDKRIKVQDPEGLVSQV